MAQNGTIQLICIQTYFAHWSAFSGYHHFLNRLPEDFRVRHHRVPRGTVHDKELDGLFEKNGLRIARPMTRGRGNSWTTKKDVLAEFRLFEEVREGLKGEGRVI